MTSLPFAATTPIHVARVGLRARDAEALSHFYGHVLGLEELRRTANIIALGAAGRELIEIEHAPALAPDDPSSAGLYHTAFLLPDRAALARWVRHAMESRIAITFAPLAGTGLYTPVDASVGTQVGTLRIVATSIEAR